ncbi:catalase family protein [Sphingomonas sp. CFBP 13728]|uniref:catalase family protein n=1 Tax=Sphingomonas sp. CFBP 13728 TaxID=2775294 RepID=UPI001FD0C775|nr:catalase family protein [Sphingomonas sp. CFBP 13728]
MLKNPIRYSPDVETIGPDEQKTIDGLNETFRYIVEKTHEDLGHAQRGVHAKSHALLEGEMVVHDDLADEQAQGIFERGRRYPVVVRMSAIPGDPIRDSVSLPRGFSIKVIGVDGERLPGAEEEVTQDFLMASGVAFSNPTPVGFLRNTKLLAATTNRAEWAKAALSKVLRPIEQALEAVGGESALLKGFGGYPDTNPIGDRYGTQAPLRFGDYIAKFDIVPESPNFRALTDQKLDESKSPDSIREELMEIFANEGGAWTLRAQLCRDLEENPIEDAATPWPEQGNPYIPVATITVKPQKSWSEERVTVLNEQTAFRPWHGVEAHRPLGSVMRARRAVYPVIQDLRSELNGCPMHEPRSLPALD